MKAPGGTDAAVLIPIFGHPEQPGLVFTERRSDLRRHPGEISFPGGRQDHPAEDLIATAVREAEEEIGLDPGEVVVELGATDAEGHLEPPDAGQVVLSVPSPEALEREAGEVRRVIGQAGTGVEPLVIVVGAAEELREDELAVVLDAAGHSSRAVILRMIRDA